MITGFRHDRVRERTRRRRIFTFVAIVLLLVVLRAPLEGLLGGVFHTVGRPFWLLEEKVSGAFLNIRALASRKIMLEEENRALREQLTSSSLDAYLSLRLRDENELLKEELGRKRDHELLYARVLARPPVSLYDTLVIDAGKEHGASVGMQAFVDGDLVIGEVTEVLGRSAVVTLYSSEGVSLPVELSTGTDTPKMASTTRGVIPATAYGTGGGNFRVIIPKAIPITAGDIVEVPSLFPSFIGVVGAVERAPESSLAVVHFKFPINISEIRSVYLALPVADSVHL